MRDRIEISSIIKKRTLALTLVLGAASFAFAQQKINVIGSITDEQNQSVPYASVTFTNKANKQFSDAALTDDKGTFQLTLVPGNYDVTIDAIGYKKSVRNKQISTAGNLGKLTLENDSAGPLSKTKDIEGVTIVATSKPVRVEIDKKTYDVKSDLTAIGGNLQDVLQNVPSVSVDPDGTVSMRGSSNVKFLVNGKPSALLGLDDGANALQSIPADQIDRIEVITNPSAKFDASGTAGILNIILKKNTKLGFNGSVVGSLGYLPRTSLNTNLSWKKGNWNWFVNGGGSYNESNGKNWTDAVYTVFPTYPDQSGTQFLKRGYQNTESKNYSKNYNGSAGLVYDINPRNSVNASVTVRSFNSESNSPVQYTDYLADNTIATGYRNSTGTNSNNGIQGDFGFDHKFNENGQNLSLSLSLQRNNSDGQSLIDQNYRQKVLQDQLNQNTLSESVVGKIDYELPIGEKSMFNAGYKIDANQNDYSFNVQRNTGSGFSTAGVELYNNNTNYTELINAAYIQFKSKIDNFGYQIGLRDEISNISINYKNLSGTDNINDKKKSYNNLFPSVFLSYDLGKNNQFLLNYSRRISRPRSWFLVPYMSFNDSQNIFRGNADLNPSYIDSFEFGYNLSKKKFTLNPVIYFKKENDDVKMTLSYVNGSFITQPMNLGIDQRIGLDLNYSYDPFSWWKIMGEFDIYQYKTTGDHYFTTEDPNNPGQTIQNHISYDGSGNSARIRMSNTFRLDKTFSVQLQGNYRAAQVEGANNNKAMYFVNLGATKTIWKGDGTIAFNIQDIFNTRARNVIQTGLGYSRETFMQWSPRQMSLSLTYRFKQGEKVDQPKRKKDINANDQGGDDQGPPM